jgi:hypothetical protein
MGSSSRQRREARRHSHPRPGRTPHGADSLDDAAVQRQIIDLIELAARFAKDAPRAAGPRIDQLNELGAVAAVPQLDPAALVVDRVLARIRAAWECGWQPQDLVHAALRRTTKHAAQWLGRAVVAEAVRTDAASRAPGVWLEQLRALDLAQANEGADGVAGPDELLPSRGDATQRQWLVALVAMDFVNNLPASQVLGPRPSEWDGDPAAHRARRPHTATPAQSLTGQRGKTLTKIRALLAKAESTEFAAEAEALTAKAQDLMTRHAIDEALLADQSGGSVDVRGIRVLIHQPYASEKGHLLNVIAHANRVRAIWNDFACHMNLVGVPTDLDQTEMLFTSTLVQATRAMTQVGEASYGSDRSTSFRKAFLTAYAERIGQRLVASADEAVAEATVEHGTDLVPVFERQAQAVTDEFERLFPHTTSGRRRTSYDARGWDAGRRAADAAVLPHGEVGT